MTEVEQQEHCDEQIALRARWLRVTPNNELLEELEQRLNMQRPEACELMRLAEGELL